MAKYNFIDATPKLARMLAGEKLDVIHGNYSTASFDPLNRVLRLPIWENADKDVYNLLVTHEVGHALYTPKTWSHDVEENIPGCPHGILNIVEDIRIEKLIRRAYPGTYSMFVRAYQKMLNADFFGIEGTDPNTLGFMNKLNIYAKCGHLVPLNFDEDEKNLVDVAMQIETWDDTLRVTKILAKFAEERDGRRNGSDGESQEYERYEIDTGDAEGDKTPDGSSGMQSDSDVSTDSNMRRTEESLSMGEDTRVLRIKKTDARNTISSKALTAKEPDSYKRFRTQNRAFVQRMVNEFNVRQHARKQKKIEVAKTGRIDPNMLPQFNINDDIFVRYGIDPKSQNHAICMYLDCSASMRSSDRITFVAREVAIMAEFCRNLKIPFQVYGWTDINRNIYASEKSYFNSIAANKMQLWVDSTMSNSRYKSAIGAIQEISEGYFSSHIEMSGTPLTEAKATAAIISAEYKRKHNTDKLHVIFLTDGDGYGRLSDINGSAFGYTHTNFSVQFEGHKPYIRRYGEPVQDARCIDDHLRSICDNYILIDVSSLSGGASKLYTEKYNQETDKSSYDSIISISRDLRKWATRFSGGQHINSDTSGAAIKERHSEGYTSFRKISKLIGKMVA